MFQGTASDVGKSLIVAGMARALANRGFKVRPFKPQNMSNNAAVTVDGGEIGRAQALQARAARVSPSVHMNPVLLKPQSEVGAQLVLQGCVRGTANASAYQRMKPDLAHFVLDSYARVKRAADIILVEGAGSASEVNLRGHDIANMGFARAADVPVILIGDIDRGGVIASLVGTTRIKKPNARIKIAVPILPHVANFDDLDPLEAEPAVDLIRLRPGNAVPGDADLVILLGAKATIADLAAFRDAGFHIDIAAHVRRGDTVLGLCGGYQRLGRTIRDPVGLEGPVGV